MPFCCAEFEKRVQAAQPDGFRIHISLWKLPYVIKVVLLQCEIAGQKQTVTINFCPWCGLSLAAKQDRES